jgi:NlpC/P60 family putative phage cell wall peptidase
MTEQLPQQKHQRSSARGFAGERECTPLPIEQQKELVRIARSWIGTPYHHQASIRGIGTDCLGLIRGIYRDFYGYDAETPPAYSTAWGETDGKELMLEAAQRHLLYVGKSSTQLLPGDVLVFRIRRQGVAKHCAMYIGEDRIVHSFETADTVEVNLHKTWRKKIAAVFQFKPRV